MLGFQGLQRVEIEEAHAGDLVAIAGFDDVNIGETVACPDNPEALPLIKVDEPTLQMTFVVNDSPFAGKEGKFVTSRQVRDRLQKELLTNVALRVEDTDSPDRFAVSGRGELHLGILIETMRREGYEFQVSQPQVIFRTIDGTPCEPFETLVLDVPEAAVGSCIERLGTRKGEMQNMENGEDGRTQMEFVVPSRGLIGFRGDFIRATRGEGIMSHSFLEYRKMQGDFDTRRNGVLISFEEGTATFYALKNAEDRGQFFISPGTKVYKGMIIGENNRPQDLEINVCKTKQLTNMRSAGAEELDTLQSPVQMTLERALEYIGPDEMLGDPGIHPSAQIAFEEDGQALSLDPFRDPRFSTGVELFNGAEWYAAHDVFEELWHHTAEPEAPLAARGCASGRGHGSPWTRQPQWSCNPSGRRHRPLDALASISSRMASSSIARALPPVAAAIAGPRPPRF